MHPIEPMVSIILPTYNQEKYVRPCISSIMDQTFENWQLIIVDDGSDDSTLEIAKEFKDTRIQFIRQNHRGINHLADSYNRALALARGRLIGIIEGDDLWPSDKLEIQIPALSSENIVLCWGRCRIIDGNGSMIGLNNGLPFVSWKKLEKGILNNRPTGSILEVLLKGNFIHCSTVLIKKEALISIGGFKQPIYSSYIDYPTWLHLSLLGEFKWINDILGCYRLHESQYTNDHRVEMIKTAGRIAEEFVTSLNENNRALFDSIFNNYSLNKLKQWREGYAYFESGRSYSRSGNSKCARSNYTSALKIGDAYVKLGALLGLVCCFAPLDMEKTLKYIMDLLINK